MGLRALFILSLATILSGQEVTPGVYRVGNGVMAPQITYRAEPGYTETARRAGLEGTVVLKAIISTEGQPEDFQIVRRLGMGLDQKALDAVRQWKFKPGAKDGQPVRVMAQIEITFRLLDNPTVERVAELKAQAADGDARSQLRLGSALLFGHGMDPDPVEAERWLRIAAEKGESIATALLGWAYARGQGVAQDPVQAFYWLTLAANSGTEGAADDLAAVTKTLSPEQLNRAQGLVRSGRKP